MSQFLIEDQMAPSPDAKHVYQLFNSNQKVLKYNQSLPDFSFDHASPELRKPLNKLNIDIQVNEYGQEPSNLAQKLKIPLQKIELSRSNFKTQEKNEMLQKPTQGQCYPGTSIVEQINSYRMGSESTNITSRTAINQSKSMNIHTTPNVTKNPKFCLNLGFSNNSKAGGVNYLSSFDQGQDSFRTTRQQVLMGQLSKRSQLCTMNHKSLLSNAKQQQNQNSTHQNNSISISHLINGVNNQTTYQNRLHEFLMKSNEKCSSNLRNCNRTGNNKATMLSPYLSNFMTQGSPDHKDVRKIQLFNNQRQQTISNHNFDNLENSVETKRRDNSKDSFNQFDSLDFRHIEDTYLNYNSNAVRVECLRGISPYQNSNYQGSPLRFNQTQNGGNYFNIQDKFLNSGSKDDDYCLSQPQNQQLSKDCSKNSKQPPQIRSHSQQYLQKTLTRGLQASENMNIFAINKDKDSSQQLIPKVLRARHDEASLDSLSIERLDTNEDQEDRSPLNWVRKQSGEFTLETSNSNEKENIPQNIQKMFSIDRMKRKVSPSMLMDNFMLKSQKSSKQTNNDAFNKCIQIKKSLLQKVISQNSSSSLSSQNVLNRKLQRQNDQINSNQQQQNYNQMNFINLNNYQHQLERSMTSAGALGFSYLNNKNISNSNHSLIQSQGDQYGNSQRRIAMRQQKQNQSNLIKNNVNTQ
eukprot:403348609